RLALAQSPGQHTRGVPRPVVPPFSSPIRNQTTRAGGLGFLSSTACAFQLLWVAHGAALAGFMADQTFSKGVKLFGQARRLGRFSDPARQKRRPRAAPTRP